MTTVFSSRRSSRRNGGLEGVSSRRNNLIDPEEQIKALKKQILQLRKLNQLEVSKKEQEKLKKKSKKHVVQEDSDDDEDFDINPLFNVADTTRDFADGIHEANQKIFKPRVDRLAKKTTGLATKPLVALTAPLGLDGLVKGGRKLLLKAGSNAYDLVSDVGNLAGNTVADVTENAGQYADGAFEGFRGFMDTGKGFLEGGLGQGTDLLGANNLLGGKGLLGGKNLLGGADLLGGKELLGGKRKK